MTKERFDYLNSLSKVEFNTQTSYKERCLFMTYQSGTHPDQHILD